MRLPLLATTGLVAVALLAGCSSLQSSDNFLGFITPYRVEVVQGNVLTKEQVALIKPGLTRAQVRDVLGSPLLTDTFHADRWDYVFTIRRQGTEPQQRKVTVLFENEKLKSISALDLPSEREFVASIDTFGRPRTIPTLAMTTEEVKALPIPPKPQASASAPEGAQRPYPPLEPRS
ncbi:MAG TPA: outer membrane protein assembly factor BamE [Rhizobacter sp.]|nr:outer membrane protein assembly factor BamE [Rhizobacter sp.]